MSKAYLNALEVCHTHGIRPSHQRLNVIEFLLSVPGHFSAEEICEKVQRKSPLLCRTTVYNTVRLLAEKGVLKTIDTGNGTTCFDATQRPHAHFYCTHCKKIMDIDIDEQTISMIDAFAPRRTTHTSLIYHGVCDDCNNEI